MKFRSLYQSRRSLLWLAVLALLAASCSASTTVDSSALTADSTENSGTPQEEPPADEPPATDESVADSTETDSTQTTDEPAPVDDAPRDTSEDDAPDDDPEESNAVEAEEDLDAEDTASSDSPTGELAVGEARVVVLDPGAEPRTELRLVIAGSCTELLQLTTVQEISQVIDGQPVPNTGPIGNVMELSTSATPVGDNYEIRSEIASAVATPDTPPQLAASINAELGRLVGLTSFATVTPRGLQVPGTSRVEGAEALGPMAGVLEGLNQTQAPLPEEAVGVGARWETRSVIEVEGLVVTNIIINELVSIDGSVIELRATGRQEVDPDSRMTTQGITGEVTMWDVTTTGTTTIDLATINPISVSTSSVGVQGFDFGVGGELEQEISTEVSSVTQPNEGCTGRTIRG